MAMYTISKDFGFACGDCAWRGTNEQDGWAPCTNPDAPGQSHAVMKCLVASPACSAFKPNWIPIPKEEGTHIYTMSGDDPHPPKTDKRCVDCVNAYNYVSDNLCHCHAAPLEGPISRNMERDCLYFTPKTDKRCGTCLHWSRLKPLDGDLRAYGSCNGGKPGLFGEGFRECKYWIPTPPPEREEGGVKIEQVGEDEDGYEFRATATFLMPQTIAVRFDPGRDADGKPDPRGKPSGFIPRSRNTLMDRYHKEIKVRVQTQDPDEV